MKKGIKNILLSCVMTLVMALNVSVTGFAKETDSLQIEQYSLQTEPSEIYIMDGNKRIELYRERNNSAVQCDALSANSTKQSEKQYKMEDITTFSISEFEKGVSKTVGGGKVYITLYYSIDETTELYKYNKVEFKYVVNNSRYRFVNVKGGYQARGSYNNGVDFYNTYGYIYKNFSDKLAGTTTERISVNSPYLQLHTMWTLFGMSGITEFKVKDVQTGTVSDLISLECVIP